MSGRYLAPSPWGFRDSRMRTSGRMARSTTSPAFSGAMTWTEGRSTSTSLMARTTPTRPSLIATSVPIGQTPMNEKNLSRSCGSKILPFSSIISSWIFSGG